MTDLKAMTDTAMSFTADVTTRWNSRLVGSVSCLECGNYLLQCFDKFCDTTHIQEFKVNPRAFLAFFKISVVCYFITLLALWFKFLVIAGIISTISVFVIITQFFFYKEVIDFLYPQKLGQNVFGSIEPIDEVKQQIIISAHHDSAHIFNYLADDAASFPRKIMISNSSVFAIAIVSWGLVIAQTLGLNITSPTFISATIFTILAYWVGNLWFFFDERGTPGAGDNMVCTALAMEVGKYFAQQKKNNKGLQHTRVIVASWDGEEAGLRGARAYIKKYKTELQTVKTYNFNLECMYDHEQLAFLTSDLNSFVPLSIDMVDECLAVSKDLDINIKKVAFPFLGGGTDAAEFAKAGIEATTLAGMQWVDRGEEPAYHTLRDTIDAVDPIAVSKSIELGIHYIMRKDASITD